MAQIKIYGIDRQLNPIKRALSDAIHGCVVDALSFPPDKRFHRFFPMSKEDFTYPAGRSDRYTIIEISLFEGRSREAKRHLIHLLFERLKRDCGIDANDVEVTLTETPRANWGIRGQAGDELELHYKVQV